MLCVFVLSGKACGWTSKDLNKTALKAIPLLVYKQKYGIIVTVLISTAWESLAIKASLIFVTCTDSFVFLHIRVLVFTFMVTSGVKGAYAHQVQHLLSVSDNKLLCNVRDVLPEDCQDPVLQWSSRHQAPKRCKLGQWFSEEGTELDEKMQIHLIWIFSRLGFTCHGTKDVPAQGDSEAEQGNYRNQFIPLRHLVHSVDTSWSPVDQAGWCW